MDTPKTLYDLLVEHLDYLRSLRYSQCTLAGNRRVLMNFARWLDLRYRIHIADRLLPKHLEAWLAAQSNAVTAKDTQLKASTINRRITAVRCWLHCLVRSGYVRQSLLDALPYIKAPCRLPGSVLTHNQMKKLLSCCLPDSTEGYRNRTMLEILYSSGIRVGEILGLDLDDVDFDNSTLKVFGKGSKERVVPIGKTALRYVESYIKAVRPYLARRNPTAEDGSRPPDCRALFLNSRGQRMKYEMFRRALEAAAARAGLTANAAGIGIRVSPHTFRRSCATELIRGGANMYHVKELLGHETLDTLKHYARLTIVDLKRTHAKYHPREKDES